jgi:hypothetical protein
MPRNTKEPFRRAERKDTLPLRTSFFFDRNYTSPTTPILVGTHVVYRKPLPGTRMTQYLVMDGAQVIKVQISYPSESDCRLAIEAHRAKSPVRLVSTRRKPVKAMTVRRNPRKEAA